MLARRGSNDPMSMVFFIVILGVIVLVGIISYFIEERRRKGIIEYCARHNLLYHEYAQSVPTTSYSFSILAEKGHTNKWLTEIAGKRGEYSFSIFEHYYVTGYGKHRHTYTDTICVVAKPGVDMPQFFVRDENMILDSLGKLFGGQDINFEEDPTFSRAFVLQGMSEPLIRKFFDRKVRSAFVTKRTRGYKYEGYRDCFAACISGKLNIEERLALLSNVMKIFREIAVTKNDEDDYLS